MREETHGANGATAWPMVKRLAGNDLMGLSAEMPGHPVAADWDDDGQLDLIVGAGDGSVSWYRNLGSADAPGPRSHQLHASSHVSLAWRSPH